MLITRLRLTGFKSFVETTEFLVQPGLTGIVGPNGCGKSNLLEALRWVMGATSAKAMRGDGMDDVIFAGTDTRPARGHAEVVLTIDNDEGRAPAPFHAEPILEVSRRIDRGEGSTYRINGSEVRARDVQLLFADASTGANSPALVRQGQISELIAARPQNRRRILEEAAGVSGLHGRRHEAELRVQAAETNLTRLADLTAELESALVRLRREARAAARYKKLGAEIRGLRSAVAHARWLAATTAEQEAALVCSRAEAANAAAVRDAATASVRSAVAAGAVAPLREEQLVAVTVHQRLLMDRDRVEASLIEAGAAIDRLKAAIVRVDADIEREERDGREAAEQSASAETILAVLVDETTNAPGRLPELEAAWRAAEADRQSAESAVASLAEERAAARAEANAARTRISETEARLRGVVNELERTASESARAGAAKSAEFTAAAAEADRISAALAYTSARLESADGDRSSAAAQEASRRAAARAAEEALAEATVELRALGRLTAQATQRSGAILLDRVSARTGFELALAAALGDDLSASMEASAGAFWRKAPKPGVEVATPDWPPGVRPLGEVVDAPKRLAARLALTGIVAVGDGDALQSELAPGARLVSAEGGLWRWDGYTIRPGAPSPAAVRLRQKARIAALTVDVERLEPAAKNALEAAAAAAAALAAADALARSLRAELAGLERQRLVARMRLDSCRREEDARLARLTLHDQTTVRLEADREVLVRSLFGLRRDLPALDDHTPGEERLAVLRGDANFAREAAAVARSTLEVFAREHQARERRLREVRAAVEAWSSRAARARVRLKDLAAERSSAMTALEIARSRPESIRLAGDRLLDRLGIAEARRVRADDALLRAETAKADADREAHAADARAADCREARAAAAARLEGARTRVEEAASALTKLTELSPEEVGAAIARDAVAIPADAPGAESHLASLEREQAAMGAVNLLAEEETESVAGRLRSLLGERDDLTGALAKLRQAIAELNAEGRERLSAAFLIIDRYFRELFTTLFQGGAAELRLVESDDPLEAGLEILACPPGKRMAVMSLMSGGEQALTAVALIFAVFLANPAPICVLDEVDAPLDDANVERFCDLLAEMRRRAATRFITITHNPLTMSRMDRLFGVTMRERGVSQLVSVDLTAAEALVAT